MTNNRSGTFAKKFELFKAAALAGAWADLVDFVFYRLGGRAWARVRGHRFHRSTLLWFREGPEGHTRLTLLLPRLSLEFPAIKSIDMEFEFYDRSGVRRKQWAVRDVQIGNPYVMDSQELPTGLKDLGREFDGSLLIKQKLNVPDKEVLAKQGLFGSTHTYIDYYKEGDYVTTLHDYCAFLPDQSLATGHLGMIPAYCDQDRETFILFHAASRGIGKKDLMVMLYNDKGECLKRRLPPLKPFAMARWMISDLFQEAETFLGGSVGQVSVKGLFRMTLRRTAYGILDKKSGAFSLDHCYYSTLKKAIPMTASQRLKVPKGCSNPFLVLEEDARSTSAMLFQSAEDPDSKQVDLLVYDSEGKCVLKEEPYALLKGDAVKKIDIRSVLAAHRILPPFIGHAEVLYHNDPGAKSFPKELNLYVQYENHGRPATVIFDADLWNGPKPVQNRSYRSCCRVVCNDVHSTRIAISNCSYDYQYNLKVVFNLSLVANGRTLCSKPMSIGPNATIFRSIEELFPDTKKLLQPSRGMGLVTTTDINCSYLTHLFFTEDRKSGALSVEHSLDV